MPRWIYNKRDCVGSWYPSLFYKDSSFLQRLYHGSGVSRNIYGIDLIPQNIFGIFEFRHQSVSYRIAIHSHTESNHGYIVFEAKLYITKGTVWSAPVLHHCFVGCQQNEQLPWASHQIRKIAGCACAGNGGNVSPHCQLQRKPQVTNPGMHHGTCVTHVPWCMSGSPTCGGGENVPGIPGTCAPAILRIWQEDQACVPIYVQAHESHIYI